MKKNSGYFYDIYKEWKIQLDVIAPILLAILGMIFGYYVKKRLFLLGMDEVVSSSTMAAFSAAPVAVYNKLINNYATKIQEDKDYDELENKNREIVTKKRELSSAKRKIQELKSEKIKTYQTHKKISEKIHRRINESDVKSTLRIAISELIHSGDGDMFKIAISAEEVFINEVIYDNEISIKPIPQYSNNTPLTPGDIN